ncbi:hypothetical protein AURDEDRAFT_173499 [Auricularia subglabra TFB-10046 SS5]|nr:hypothetical protein AURDEDRAFT_173499 [Auricularia subglabra TFB-10046 SS5]
MLNWKTHHISWDMDFIRRHRGAPLVQWCIVPVKKKPWFFDVRDLDIPSTLYPRAEYSDESEDDSSSSSSEDNRRKRKGNAKSDDEGVLRLAEISDADEFLADENDIYDTIRHYPLADPQPGAATDRAYKGKRPAPPSPKGGKAAKKARVVVPVEESEEDEPQGSAPQPPKQRKQRKKKAQSRATSAGHNSDAEDPEA